MRFQHTYERELESQDLLLTDPRRRLVCNEPGEGQSSVPGHGGEGNGEQDSKRLLLIRGGGH